MLTSFGSGDKVISFVDGFERLTGFPIPLFQTFKEADFKKYSFCDFVDLKPNEFPRAQNASSSLFIFSFTDLCEMPALVRRVLKKRFNAEKKKNAENSTQSEDNNKEKNTPMNFVLGLPKN
ncbi:hypothetical protein M9Y10_034852 [Tritrichomonas musculus]|uniref:Uncharacterized protein n=1 Tax=Tritrichomonas musculus TaxID=1915356 RepID=A0ABR2KG27_9EUKA